MKRPTLRDMTDAELAAHHDRYLRIPGKEAVAMLRAATAEQERRTRELIDGPPITAVAQ
jgi:hypothetical protein